MYPAFEEKNHDLLHPACAVFEPLIAHSNLGKKIL
jgi:hypothetical protein